MSAMCTMLSPACPMRVARHLSNGRPGCSAPWQARSQGSCSARTAAAAGAACAQQQVAVACSSRRLIAVASSKGFGSTDTSNSSGSAAQEANPAAAGGPQDDAIEALEARMRSRRAKRVEAKVKVESATVDAVQGKTEVTPQQQAEGNFVLAMLFLFGLVMVEGLLIAGSGFLPEDWDAFIEDTLYPNYTGLVGLFLAASTAYGLWKIGKLPLPFLGSPPPESKE